MSSLLLDVTGQSKLYITDEYSQYQLKRVYQCVIYGNMYFIKSVLTLQPYKYKLIILLRSFNAYASCVNFNYNGIETFTYLSI